MLRLMYITNNPTIAEIAQDAGVNRIWVDMEYLGKEARQGGLDTVKSHHTVEDVVRLRSVVDKAELMVRVNPIHDASSNTLGTELEVDRVIEAGADLVMLPMAKNPQQLTRFVRAVDGRAQSILLLETREAVECLDDMLAVPGLDFVHIGLNDLHLSYGLDFMFELLANGMVEDLCRRIGARGIPYGFGGIARVGYGLLPAEYIITEHVRLNSSAAILSRDFCDANKVQDPESVRELFKEGVEGIRACENDACCYTPAQFAENHRIVCECVKEIVAARRISRVVK